MNSHWSGITDPEKLHSGFVDLVDQLADQSRDGNWDAVLQLLGTHANLSPQSMADWRHILVYATAPSCMVGCTSRSC
ncbi:hypothetical protein KbCgl_23340 [Corynebacterium glutamicum]|nr:hypothetical protein KbCgl_23340 [Corynebacterium glutamicum]